jgi:hypothetical protein
VIEVKRGAVRRGPKGAAGPAMGIQELHTPGKWTCADLELRKKYRGNLVSLMIYRVENSE